jgi:hypothetical protein
MRGSEENPFGQLAVSIVNPKKWVSRGYTNQFLSDIRLSELLVDRLFTLVCTV